MIQLTVENTREIGVYPLPQPVEMWQQEMIASEPRGEIYKPVQFYAITNNYRDEQSGIVRYWFDAQAPPKHFMNILRVGFFLPDDSKLTFTQEEIDILGTSLIQNVNLLFRSQTQA